jgi:hypothetical protein
LNLGQKWARLETENQISRKLCNGRNQPTVRGRSTMGLEGRKGDLRVCKILPLREVVIGGPSLMARSLLLVMLGSWIEGPSLENSTGATGSPGVLGGGVDSSAAGELALEGDDKEG